MKLRKVPKEATDRLIVPVTPAYSSGDIKANVALKFPFQITIRIPLEANTVSTASFIAPTSVARRARKNGASTLINQGIKHRHILAEKCGVDDAIHKVTSTFFGVVEHTTVLVVDKARAEFVYVLYDRER